MSDDKNKKDFRDRTRINTSEDYEVRYWSEKFNVSPDELREAAKAAGSSDVKSIESKLKGRSGK